MHFSDTVQIECSDGFALERQGGPFQPAKLYPGMQEIQG